MGALLVVLSAFGFSTLGIFGKFAYEAGFMRNEMLFYRFLISLPVLAVILAVARALPRDARAFGRAVLLGAVGIGIEATLYFVTLEEVGASLTGVFLYLYPSAVAVLSHLFLNQRLSRAKWICVVASLAGVVLAVDPFGERLTALGFGAGLATGVWYAVYILMSDRLTRDQHPLTVSAGIVLGACLFFGVLTFYDSLALTAVGEPFAPRPSVIDQGWPLLGLALVAGVLPFTTLYAGMKRVGATQASVLSSSEVVFTILLAALFLGEKLTPIQMVGSLVILTSVIVIQRVR